MEVTIPANTTATVNVPAKDAAAVTEGGNTLEKVKGVKSLAGPWIKQPDLIPFLTKPETYYKDTASPGHVIKQGDEYLMFLSASMPRSLGIARTNDRNAPRAIDPQPIIPPEEQIENSSLYLEPSNKTWFLFTNHIGLDGGEYTDAVWVYWSKDLNKWDAMNKAVVLDGKYCAWSRKCLGMPSVVRVGKRPATFYDAPVAIVPATWHARSDWRGWSCRCRRPNNDHRRTTR